MAARRVGVSRFFVSDRRSNVRSKIGRCRITTFRQNTDFNVGLTPDLHAKQRGFTLIELLVVVLIIGILAAVTLPQYRLAVAKSRLVQLVTAGQSIKQAEEAYFLANGEYTTDWTVLNIDFAGTWYSDIRYFISKNSWAAELGSGREWVALWDSRMDGLRLYFRFDNATESGKKKCFADNNNSFANLLCKNITNRKEKSTTDGSWYVYYWN